MDKITVKQAAERWGITPRRVQGLCKEGKIPGAQRWGRAWMLPADAQFPSKAHTADPNLPMPRKTPFLIMTDLYNEPGRAAEAIAALHSNPEAQILLAAEFAYCHGGIDEVYKHAQYILDHHTGMYAVISGGILLSLCAIWQGDLAMWKKARDHISKAPCRTSADHDIVALALASCDSSIRNTDLFPEWFIRGSFERLPHDALPAAWIYYARFLIITAHEVAIGKRNLPDASGLVLMKTIPYILNPLISRTNADKNIAAELYLRLLCAVAYQQCGDIPSATEQIDKAIVLALPDQLFSPLVENRRLLGQLLDERLLLANPEAAKRVKELHKQFHQGWVKLHNAVLDKTVSASLSQREREVGRLAAYGLTNAEIGSRLGLSEHSIKSMLTVIRNKTGASSRSEISAYI